MKINSKQINALIDEMADKLQAQLSRENRNNPCFIGIHTGGIWIARQLHKRLGIKTPLGELNIAF